MDRYLGFTLFGGGIISIILASFGYGWLDDFGDFTLKGMAINLLCCFVYLIIVAIFKAVIVTMLKKEDKKLKLQALRKGC